MATPKHQLLLGTFIHSKTPQELEYRHDTAVAVSSQGKIVGIQQAGGNVNEARDTLLKELGWDPSDVDVIACKEGQFFFPGFIGTHVAPLHLEERLD
jgi:guanine deaminase